MKEINLVMEKYMSLFRNMVEEVCQIRKSIFRDSELAAIRHSKPELYAAMTNTVDRERVKLAEILLGSPYGGLIANLLGYTHEARDVANPKISAPSMELFIKMIDAMRLAISAHIDEKEAKVIFNIDGQADNLLMKSIQGKFGEANEDIYILCFVLQILGRNGFIANEMLNNFYRDGEKFALQIDGKFVIFLMNDMEELEVTATQDSLPEGFSKVSSSSLGYFDPMIIYMKATKHLKTGFFAPNMPKLGTDIEALAAILPYLNLFTLRQGVELGKLQEKTIVSEVTSHGVDYPVFMAAIMASVFAGLSSAGTAYNSVRENYVYVIPQDPLFVQDLNQIVDLLLKQNVRLQAMYSSLIDDKARRYFGTDNDGFALIRLIMGFRVNLHARGADIGARYKDAVLKCLRTAFRDPSFYELKDHFSDVARLDQGAIPKSANYPIILLPKLLNRMICGRDSINFNAKDFIELSSEALEARINGALRFTLALIQLINKGQIDVISTGPLKSITLQALYPLITPDNIDRIAAIRDINILQSLVLAGYRGEKDRFVEIIANPNRFLPAPQASAPQASAASASAASASRGSE